MAGYEERCQVTINIQRALICLYNLSIYFLRVFLLFRNTLEYVDYELDKIVTVFQSHLSAKEFWTPTIRVEDRVLLLVKYISHVVHKTVKAATAILRDGEFHAKQVSRLAIFVKLSKFTPRFFSCVATVFGKVRKI